MDTDVVIVGAGPVGIFGVFECGMQRLGCHVVDAMESLGGQCSALYPEKPIYDIPGFSSVDAADLIYRLQQQAAPFLPVYHLGKTAQTLNRLPNGRFEVLLSNGLALSCSAVIIAAGAGALRPNRPPLAGIEEFEGRGVLYSLTNVESLRDKKVVIAGGGDSAIDWALALVGIASCITLVHRRDRFRAAPASVHAMAQAQAKGQIDVVTPFQLQAIEGRGGVLNSVIVSDIHGKSRRIEADILLALFGVSTDIGPIMKWGPSLNQGQVEVTQQDCQTSVPGLYAAGDIASYPNKLKLILSGFSEIATAAHAIRRQMFPGEIQHVEHSTTAGVPSQIGLRNAQLTTKETQISSVSELTEY